MPGINYFIEIIKPHHYLMRQLILLSCFIDEETEVKQLAQGDIVSSVVDLDFEPRHSDSILAATMWYKGHATVEIQSRS